jgi:hypothetical protein
MVSKLKEFKTCAHFVVCSLCFFQAATGSLIPSTLTVNKIASHNFFTASHFDMFGKTIVAHSGVAQQAIVH